MIQFFSIVTITGLWCMGLVMAMSDGMVLHKLMLFGQKVESGGGKWVKPFITCPYCMPSVHSLFGVFFAWNLGIVELSEWLKILISYPLIVCGGTAFNWLFLSVISFLNGNNDRESSGDSLPAGEP